MEMAKSAPLLRISGLKKRYGSIVVADDIDLELPDRGCLGVIGPNGAGKSTLFHLLTGVVRQDSGSLMLDGVDLSALPPHRRPSLGVVRAFQIPQCFESLSVYENVLLASYAAARLRGARARELAHNALRRTGLSGAADIPAGKLRLLDRKRLELAKALASNARLLLLDEIAGGLTDAETESLIALIQELKTMHSIIWIEHIPHALKAVADRVMVLNFGRKVMEGAPDEVMNSALVREIYMGIPADEAA
jgi:branched-chain amino acid transport system ATP-binding protein